MANLTVQTQDSSISGNNTSSNSVLYAGNRPNQHPPVPHNNSYSGNNPRNQNYYPRRGRGANRNRGRGRFPSSSGYSDSLQCQICQKWGHSASKCYHRFDITYIGDSVPLNSSPSQSQPQPPPQALLAEPSSHPSSQWFLDFGATTHVTNDINNLSSHTAYSGSDLVHMGNGQGLPISHKGSSTLYTSGKPLQLKNILFVPAITKNLLSISQLLHDNNVSVEFTGVHCFVKDPSTNQILLHGFIHDGLYKLQFPVSQHQTFHTALLSSDIWHGRLLHCSFAVLQTLSKQNKIDSSSASTSFCASCSQAKAHKLPFYPSLNKATRPLEVIHTDLWGPAPVSSVNGHKYYVHFIDEFSRFGWFFACTSKSDVTNIFTQFKSKVENLLNYKVQTLQCDGGTEFSPIRSKFPEIQFQISCPHTPQQNGLAERKHRHVVELSLAAMYHASIPLEYWDWIFESSLFVINRLPSVPTGTNSPFEILFHQSPDYKFLRVLGCQCFPLLRPYNRHKLEPRSLPCVFMGYSSHHKGYRCLHLDSNKIYISRNVQFNEVHFPFAHLSPTPSTDQTPTTFPSTLTILPFQPTTVPTLPAPTSVPSDTLPAATIPPTAASPTTFLPASSTATPPNSSPNTLSLAPPTTSSSQTTHPMLTRTKTRTLKPKQFSGHHLYQAVTSFSQAPATDPTCFTQAVKSEK